MPLATKNGSLIVKSGSIAENCNCCASGWYCYGGTCASMIASVRARVVSFPEATSDVVDSGSVSTYRESSVSEAAARASVASAYNAGRGTYRLRSQPSSGWVTLNPSSSADCTQCEYIASVSESTAIPIASEWKVIVDVCDTTSCIAVVGYQIPTRLSVEYSAPQISAADTRILSQDGGAGSGGARYSAYLDDAAFASVGSCSYSNNSPNRVHQNASGGSPFVSAVDYAIAGIGIFPAVRLVQTYLAGSVIVYPSSTQTNGGTANGTNQKTKRIWTAPVSGVSCTTLANLQQATSIEIELTTR